MNSRKPLVGEFQFLGRTVFIIANHFNSKGGDQPLFGRFQPPVLSSEVQRLQQATAVHAFVQSLQAAIDAAGTDAGILVMGDLNDYEFSAPLMTLKGTLLEDLMERLPIFDRHTYDFEGNSQVLDHILIGGAFRKPLRYLVEIDPVHANADYSVATRLSDHDPVVAAINFLRR
ncbi:MAG TPA: hypothetical protein VE981_06165 [Planctomycetota bacterium]|nr:hypothetical protein [Planctomycetota bacterium]